MSETVERWSSRRAFILSFYSVVSGWSIEYLINAVNGSFASRSPAEIGASFDTFLADPLRMTFNHTLFMLLTMSVVAAGVSGGLEKLNNLLMPLLYIILVILAIYATTTEGFGQAITWLFTPDPGAITMNVVLSAMGHAFFTLAEGACALMVYGAYMPDHQSLTRAAVSVVVLNLAVAILAGIAVFSVVFTQGMDPAEGRRDDRDLRCLGDAARDGDTCDGCQPQRISAMAGAGALCVDPADGGGIAVRAIVVVPE